MARILPFRAIRPNPFYADQLVFTKPQTESVAGDEMTPGALPPLKILLETGARLRPETPQGQERAYQDIRANLEGLLTGGRLVQEKKPGIYVYEYAHQHYRQTGVWALTSLEDYRDGTIKTHELTFGDSVRRLRNYRRHTGLEGNPVLLAYPPVEAINSLIAQVKTGPQETALGNRQGLHRLWKVEDPQLQQQLIDAFANIKTSYLADGHHRLESADELTKQQSENNSPLYDTISSLYMATDQLRLQEYNRVVIPANPVALDELFRHLNQCFFIQESRKPVQPTEQLRMGMCLNGEWYHLMAKAHTYSGKSISEGIGAAILQEQVLGPLFGITDPKSDPKLKCAGGEKAMEEIGALFHSHPQAIAFTLCPLTAELLIGVADAGEILPPKSTWFDPKVPYGLLLYKH
jgi:uncharacterized protein (DUF1015 family)